MRHHNARGRRRFRFGGGRNSIESLEPRRLLSAAPVAVGDAYHLPPSGVLTVGDLARPAAPVEILPDPSQYAVDQVVRASDGAQLHHPGFLTLGGQPLHYGEIVVTDPGTKLTLHQYLEVGYAGFGRLNVHNGGTLQTTNWTELGEARGGVGVGHVTGADSRWINDNFLVVGDNGGHGRLTVDAGAMLINGNHLTVGQNGATGLLTVRGGAAVLNRNWTEVGEHAETRGELVVEGSDSIYQNQEWMEVGGVGEGVVTLIDDGRLEVGGRLQVAPSGRLRGDGSVKAGMLDNEGAVEPGAPIGLMRFENTLTQYSSGRLELELGGLSRGAEYDAVDVQGAFVAGGTLSMRFVRGFAPHAGDRFELVQSHAIRGGFQQVLIHGLEAGFRYELQISGGTLTLVALNNGVSLPDEHPQGVLANDHDPDGDVLSTILLQQPSQGNVLLNANGSFRYVAGDAFDGHDAFVYAATDRFRRSEPVHVEITNARPIARPDAYHAAEDTPFVSPVSVLANDSDDDAVEGLTARLVALAPGVGDLDLRPDGTFTYTPAENYAGNFTFLYVASDGLTDSHIAVVEVFVEGASDPPVAVDDHFEVRSGESLVVRSRELTSNDQEPDGQADRLIVVNVGAPDPAKGTIELIDSDGAVLGFRFTPAPHFIGHVTVPYTIRDPDGFESSANVFIEVTSPNHPPIAGNDRFSMLQDSALQIPTDQLLHNDFDRDGDHLRIVAVGDATHGEVFFDDSDGLVTFQPPAGFVGTASFLYTVSDGHGGEARAKVVVDVKPLVQSVPGRVQGAGSLDGWERLFAFSANSQQGDVEGWLWFIDWERRIRFNATRVTGLAITPDGRQASISGEGRLNGRDGFEFLVSIEDNGRDGRDRFRIQISSRIPEYDSLAHAENEGRIDRLGNIRIRPSTPPQFSDLLLARELAFAEIASVSTRSFARRR